MRLCILCAVVFSIDSLALGIDINTLSSGVYLALNRLYAHSGGRARSHERLMETSFADPPKHKAISPPEAVNSDIKTITCKIGNDLQEWEVYKDGNTEKDYYYQRVEGATQWDFPCEENQLVAKKEYSEEEEMEEADWWVSEGRQELFSFKGVYDKLPGVKHLRKVSDSLGDETSDAEFVKDFGGQNGFLTVMTRLQRIVVAVETELVKEPDLLEQVRPSYHAVTFIGPSAYAHTRLMHVLIHKDSTSTHVQNLNSLTTVLPVRSYPINSCPFIHVRSYMQFKELWKINKQRELMFQNAPFSEDEPALVAFAAGSAWCVTIAND
jgi:hypothetical protein